MLYSTKVSVSNKQKCIDNAKENLESLGLLEFFNMADFNHVYRKLNAANCNAYLVGLDVSDYIIFNYKTVLNP